LSFEELLHLLSLDDGVLDAVFEWWTPPIRRLPPLLLTRVLRVLDPFLVTRDSYGVPEIFWYHRQLWTAARHYSITSPDIELQYHHQLVQYYTGEWHSKAKPFDAKNRRSLQETKQFFLSVYGNHTGSDQSHSSLFTSSEDGLSATADRLVPSQPWIIEGGLPNTRKLWMLPKHALFGCMWKKVKAALCSIGTLECAASAGMKLELQQIYATSIDFLKLKLKDGSLADFEKAEINDLLESVQAFDRYLKRSIRSLHDISTVLQYARFSSLDSPIRQATIAFASEEFGNASSSLQRSLVIPLKPSPPSHILSAVSSSKGIIQCCDIYFATSSTVGDNDNAVFVAAIQSPLLIVYEMIQNTILLEYTVSTGKYDQLTWNPSGDRLFLLSNAGNIIILQCSDLRDGITATVAVEVNKWEVNYNSLSSCCVSWSGNTTIVAAWKTPEDVVVIKAVSITGVLLASRRISIGEVVNDASEEILCKIVPPNRNEGQLDKGVISHGGQYYVINCRSKVLTVKVFILQGANKGTSYDLSFEAFSSAGGGSSICSITFSSPGMLVITIRGNIVMYRLGSSLEECTLQRRSCRRAERNDGSSSVVKKISNWTNFRSCFPVEKDDFAAVAEESGSIWIVTSDIDETENNAPSMRDIALLSYHNKCVQQLSMDINANYLISKVENQLVLWDLQLLKRKALNATIQKEEHMRTKQIVSVFWHPSGSHYYVSGLYDSSTIHDGCTGVQTQFYDSSWDHFIYYPRFGAVIASDLGMMGLLMPNGKYSGCVVANELNWKRPEFKECVKRENEIRKYDSTVIIEMKALLAEAEQQDEIAFVLPNRDIIAKRDGTHQDKLLLFRLASMSQSVFTLHLPSIVLQSTVDNLLTNSNVHKKQNFALDVRDKYDGVNTLLASRAINNTVVFFRLEWSADNTSATAHLLHHRVQFNSDPMQIKFKPLLAQSEGNLEWEKETLTPTLVIGCSAGEVQLMKVVIDDRLLPSILLS
jgi:hypothetical protein